VVKAHQLFVFIYKAFEALHIPSHNTQTTFTREQAYLSLHLSLSLASGYRTEEKRHDSPAHRRSSKVLPSLLATHSYHYIYAGKPSFFSTFSANFLVEIKSLWSIFTCFLLSSLHVSYQFLTSCMSLARWRSLNLFIALPFRRRAAHGMVRGERWLSAALSAKGR
jgi:hypothetical protein